MRNLSKDSEAVSTLTVAMEALYNCYEMTDDTKYE